jgi:cytochrome P450
MVAAGTLTTAHFFKTTLSHLLAKPALLAKLKSELITAIPNPEELPSLRDIEAMPYLHAVIQEGSRLSYGATLHLPRVSPKRMTIRHMYAATAVSDKGQLQGAITRGSSQGLRPGKTNSLCI